MGFFSIKFMTSCHILYILSQYGSSFAEPYHMLFVVNLGYSYIFPSSLGFI